MVTETRVLDSPLSSTMRAASVVVVVAALMMQVPRASYAPVDCACLSTPASAIDPTLVELSLTRSGACHADRAVSNAAVAQEVYAYEASAPRADARLSDEQQAALRAAWALFPRYVCLAAWPGGWGAKDSRLGFRGQWRAVEGLHSQ